VERILHYDVRIRSQQQQAQSPARELNFIAVCTKVCARAKLIKICIFRGWELFTPYLNNQPLSPYDFSISRLYSSRPIPQCSLYAEKPCN